MSMDPALAATLFGSLGIAVGGFVGWFGKHRIQAQAARPAISVDGDDIIIANRINEDLQLVRIAADAQFALAFRSVKEGEEEFEAEHWFRRARDVRQNIGPKRQARLRMLLKRADQPPTVTLTFNSSSGTLKRERIRIRMPA